MDRKLLIEEFTGLLNIPRFEENIIHYIEELKDLLKDDIASYKEINGIIGNTPPHMITVDEKSRTPKGPVYKFELSLSKNGKWIPVSIDPPPPPSKEPNDIIPPEITAYITGFKPDREKIEKVKSFKPSLVHGRTFDLTFTRFSHHHIAGTICEYYECEDESGKLRIPPISQPNKFETNETGLANYKELLIYMEKYPEFKKHIFHEFYMKWKLLLDKENIG